MAEKCGQNVRQLQLKTVELFQTRGLHEIAQYTIDDVMNRRNVLQRLMDLQGSIYALDRYGETSWNVDSFVLGKLWLGICRRIQPLNVSTNVIAPRICDILRYQSIELDLRRGLFPTDINPGSFYRLKTCDVRMMRTILCAHSCREFSAQFLSYLDLLDICAEVCDDMLDMDEDVCDFNCNRFVLSRVVLGDLDTLVDSVNNFV